MNSIGKLRETIFSPLGLMILAALGLGGYWLLGSQSVAFEKALPFALFGGCMLMHLVMHRGEGGCCGHHAARQGEREEGKRSCH